MENSVNPLISNLQRRVCLTPEEIDLIGSKVTLRVLKRKDFLLYKGDTCKHFNYVASGCLRVYGMDDDGFVHINYFAPEDWWAADIKSFFQQTPSRYYIDALEDTLILQLKNQDFNKLLEAVPKLEKWLRVLLQNALITAEDRVSTDLSMHAEERYQEFLNCYPYLEKRVSQKQIASFLGITPEFFSMLKKKRKHLK